MYSGSVSSISVLVPGAGLGRLAYEIARLGYTCQGNEFSLFMLFASNFILNKLAFFSLFLSCHILQDLSESITLLFWSCLTAPNSFVKISS